jgi:hypothetical protein
METAIKKAIEGGWKPLNWFDPYVCEAHKEDANVFIRIYGVKGERTIINVYWAVCQPLFWQCLGKALDWSFQREWHGIDETDTEFGEWWGLEWQYHWHQFIDHLAEGKDVESFFTELISK